LRKSFSRPFRKYLSSREHRPASAKAAAVERARGARRRPQAELAGRLERPSRAAIPLWQHERRPVGCKINERLDEGARLVLALGNCWPTSPTSFLRILVGGERWSASLIVLAAQLQAVQTMIGSIEKRIVLQHRSNAS